LERRGLFAGILALDFFHGHTVIEYTTKGLKYKGSAKLVSGQWMDESLQRT